MRVVFAGAGFTALEAAARIKKKLPSATVTLITKHEHKALQFPADLLLEHGAYFSIKEHCTKHSIEYIEGALTKLDREHSIVHVGETYLHYDYLILDLGSEHDNSFQGSFACSNRHQVHELKHHVIGQLVAAKHDNASEHKTFVVAGSNVQALEITFSLKQFLEHAAEKHYLFPEELAVVYVSKNIPKYLQRLLEERDIEFYESTVQSYAKTGVQLSDRTIESHTLIWSETKPNSFLETTGLPMLRGAVMTNNHLQTADPRIFAVGGCGTSARDLPVTTLYRNDAEVLADNVVALAKSKRMKKFSARSKPHTIRTGNNSALLVTKYWHCHGSLAWRIRQYFIGKHMQKIQKP